MNTASMLATLADEPLAILPGKLDALASLAAFPVRPAEFVADAGRLVERFAAARVPSGSRGRTIAGITIRGAISQRDNLLTALFGGTSTEAVRIAVRQAAADASVSTIILDIDSPGGGVYGVAEAGAEIAKAARTKRVVAQVNSLAASAAYWIASQASEIVVTPGGEAGSIGVYTVHRDISAAADRAGVKHTIVRAGRYKAEGNPYAPLADDARASLQKRVDEYYAMFVSAVASGRRVTPSDVRKGFGQGRVVGATEAVKLGMADIPEKETAMTTAAKPKPKADTPGDVTEFPVVLAGKAHALKVTPASVMAASRAFAGLAPALDRVRAFDVIALGTLCHVGLARPAIGSEVEKTIKQVAASDLVEVATACSGMLARMMNGAPRAEG